MGRLIPAAVFALAFLLYDGGAYPGLAPRDAGDLIRCARDLAVAHPPGYPLYMLAGRLWLRLLPWGDAAYRLNLLSAASAALACALLAAWAQRRGRWAGWTAGLTLACCAPLWKFSGLAEMYTAQAAFASGLLFLSEGGAETFDRRARLSGLLLGLGLVNHQTLVFFLPALVWLWYAEAKSHGLALQRCAVAVATFAGLGLLVYAAVPIRLGDLGLGLAVLRRAPYGSLTLFSGFSRPFAQAAPGLLKHFVSGLWSAGSPLLSLAASTGLYVTRRSRWAPAAALGLAASAFFFLLTRFDASSWVARSALESAFVLPSLWLCAGAGLLAARLEAGGGLAAPTLCAALVSASLLAHGAALVHRDDFSAPDYARNLLRTLEPGKRAVVRGDTAQFTLALEPAGRDAVPEQDAGAGTAALAVGLPLEAARALSGGKTPQAAGLALAIAPQPGFDAWPLYAIRRGRALSAGESYARDAALAYAFAHYNAARLAELAGRDGTPDALAAAAWDPEDFGLKQSGH